jgi:ABC-type sugar transport system ATPase subunit
VTNGHILSVSGVGKSFGAVEALHDVDLAVSRGEIIGLVGDNGAGKSTLMNIISGAYCADVGQVAVNGHPLASLADAKKLGVGVVYQDLALAPNLSLAENLFLGNEKTRRFGPFTVLNRSAMRVEARRAIELLGISTLRDVRLPVQKLSGGQRQVLAVARAIKWAEHVVLLDEPTAALGPKQVGIVLDSIKKVAAQGICVVLVSHDIPSVLKLVDRIAILCHGTIVADRPPAGLSVAEVVATMMGEGVDES